MSLSPAFIITIDNEMDNGWLQPEKPTTRNAEFLPRFQETCEKYGFKVVYLTDYEMAVSPVFQELGKDILRRNTGEIGMHLHAWNTPPKVDLEYESVKYQPYLIEYPEEAMRLKIRFMTELLSDTFNIKTVSHRAGRWGFNEVYARLLVEAGYWADCSVTPYLSWRIHSGAPHGNGGPDYRDFPDYAYFLDLNNISRAGKSPLLEVPTTVSPRWRGAHRNLPLVLRRLSLVRRIINRISPPRWLRPDGNNLSKLLALVNAAAKRKTTYLEFMLHSSELMPGGSPYFPGESGSFQL